MIRKAHVFNVSPNSFEEYERRHNPIWKELEEVLKEHGAHNYSIFLRKKTAELFAYLEIENEEKWNQVAETDVCRRWWAYMKDIMETNPDKSPVAENLKEVFHLQ